MYAAIILAVAFAMARSAVPALALDVPVIGDNLIANGSFEDSPLGPVPAGGVPAGWWREAYGADGQLEVVPGGAPGQGERCLKLSMVAGNDSGGLHGPLIEIDPTQAYIQFGWIRLGADAERSGMNLGRQWLEADEEPADQEKSRSYNYVVSGANPGDKWAYYEQLLLPDDTPDDGSFRADQIPANARHLRVWAICYRWAGEGYFDGLGLYQVDYAAIARTEISARLGDARTDEMRDEIEAALGAVPEDSAPAQRGRELLAELGALRERATATDGRHVLDWIADRERTPGLIDELEDAGWELKIEALLQEAG